MPFLKGTQGILVAILFFILFVASTTDTLGAPKKLKSFFQPTHREEIIEKDTIPITQLEEEAIESEDETAINQLFHKAWNNDVLDPFKKQKPFLGTAYDCSMFGLPVPIAKVISKFGMRRGRMHAGTDIKVYAGDPINAVADGKVRFAKYYGGYGNIVIIRHHNGLETVYAHLSKILVEVNQDVKKGECIGLGGRTGRATGTHLHFEIRVAGRPVNPESVYNFATGTVCNIGYPKRENIAQTEEAEEPKPETVRVENHQTRIHRVASGETLFAIAKKYGVALPSLYKWNDMNKRSRLSIGQKIVVADPQLNRKEERVRLEKQPVTRSVPMENNGELKRIERYKDRPERNTEKAAESVAEIPAEKSVEKSIEKPGEKPKPKKSPKEEALPAFHRIEKGETLSALSRKFGVSVGVICRINDIEPDAPLSLGQKIWLKETKASAKKGSHKAKSNTHFVEDGDTLAGIARKYSVTIEQLCAWNGLKRTDRLRIGQKLKIVA